MDNMGLLFFALGALLVFAALIVGLYFIFRRTTRYKVFRMTIFREKALFEMLMKKIFFSPILRSFIKGYLSFCLALCVSMQTV